MKSNSYRLWLFDKKGSRNYGFAALFLFLLTVGLPIILGTGPLIMVLTILLGTAYIFYQLPKVFAFQLEFEILQEFLRIKPLKQARLSCAMVRMDIPYDSISKLESYGMEYGKNGYYHLNINSRDISLALKCTAALRVSSIIDTKLLGDQIKKELDSKAIDYEWIGEEKLWQSTSMKIQIWVSTILLLGLIGFTVYWFIIGTFEISDSVYLMIFLFEFFFLIIGFNYYWKKFRSHNS